MYDGWRTGASGTTLTRVGRQSPEQFVRHVTRRIAQYRKARGLTQAEAAVAMGIALKNWQRIEAGQNLTLHTLARVAAVLKCAATELVGNATVPTDAE